MTELLAPAGSREALVAAVQSGADAVYLGVDAFNARRSARNFTTEELRDVVAYCHLRGVRVYLTLNTLVTDRELRRLAATAKAASDAGVDAILVQDWGVLDTLRRVVPDVPLHASTQMTVHTLSGVEEAARLGVTRAVLARELTRDEIRAICEKSPIEVEVFVHGALCVCWSGQCAMSAVIGQRSGNRGACAQPCRLPYNGAHPLSLKDNNLAAYVPELQDMGVACLKIEGRMKRPEYVAAVTGVYARLLREHRAATDEEQAQLEAAFSRSGFTDGYYTNRKGGGMFGVRPRDARWPEEWFSELRADYEKEPRRIPAAFDAAIEAGAPLSLTAADCDGHRMTVTGAVPETARTRSLTAAEVEERLRKTGGTVFSVSDCRVTVGDGLAVSAAALNALRRDALSALAEQRTAVPERRTNAFAPEKQFSNIAEPPRMTVSLARAEQLTEELVEQKPAMIALSIDQLDKIDLSKFADRAAFCAVLPRIYRTQDEAELRRLLERAASSGVSAVGIGNLGHFALTRDLPLQKRGEQSLNVFNSTALRFLMQQGLDTAMLSFELRREQIRDIQKCIPCEAVVYGRLPLMITENRVGGKENILTDRKGERFPVLEAAGGRSEIENAKTLCLADRDDWCGLGLSFARLRFTTETPAECAAILRAYLSGSVPQPEDFTHGLFYRGVE